ncbi:MAG: response regulator transcription factor [Planctomycetota bacterium]|jgi:DNA-binding response OmpR family regulator
MAKVLVVDDDVELAGLVKTIVESDGHEVVTAHSADECRTKIADGPDLLILDVMMERRNDGFVLAREFRARDDTKSIPIIMLTSINQEFPMNFKPDSDWLPVDKFLEKPAKPEEILAAVREALGS